MQGKTCCFIGHRDIPQAEDLREEVYMAVADLIVHHGVDTFLFGSKSEFNALCYDVVTQLKQRYPHIERIYVRAEFPYINDDYKSFLLERYEDTYFPEKILGAGRSVYVQRNYKMIDKSQFCVIYYQPSYSPGSRKSGTEIALEYAMEKKKHIIQLPENM